MSRGFHYVTLNRRASHNPLRSSPLYQHPAAVWGTAFYDGTWNEPKVGANNPQVPAQSANIAPPAALVALDPARELRAAEAGMREAVRGYGFARARLGDANKTRTPGLMKLGEVYAPSPPIRPEVVREARRMAFCDLNRSRARLRAARRRLDAARLALGLPLADADAKFAAAGVAGRA